jgi:acyl carrier protein
MDWVVNSSAGRRLVGARNRECLRGLPLQFSLIHSINRKGSAVIDIVNEQDIRHRVVATIAAALDCDPQMLSTSVTLHEAGAESLDFLDIAFRLEKEFRIRMPRLNVLQRAEEHFGAEALVADGVLTPLGLEVLRDSMPEARARIQPGLHASEVGRLLSVDTFVRIVIRMMAATREALAACPACGGSLEMSPVTPEATCSRCRRVVPFPAGDDVLLQDLTARTR